MTFADDDPRHGTTAGYQQHRVQQVPMCAPCRAANRDSMRERRKDPDYRARGRRQKAVRERAIWRLIKMHRADFDRLVADEWRAEQEDAS